MTEGRPYPSRVADNHYGRCLVATRDVETGTTVEWFEGPVGSWAEVPEAEVIYAIALVPRRWLVPRSPARYLNHSCDPSCHFDQEGRVFTRRPVREGEELTIAYDWADAEQVRLHPDHYFWDPRWTFRCACGSPSCRGQVDSYRPI